MGRVISCRRAWFHGKCISRRCRAGISQLMLCLSLTLLSRCVTSTCQCNSDNCLLSDGLMSCVSTQPFSMNILNLCLQWLELSDRLNLDRVSEQLGMRLAKLSMDAAWSPAHIIMKALPPAIIIAAAEDSTAATPVPCMDVRVCTGCSSTRCNYVCMLSPQDQLS